MSEEVKPLTAANIDIVDRLGCYNPPDRVQAGPEVQIAQDIHDAHAEIVAARATITDLQAKLAAATDAKWLALAMRAKVLRAECVAWRGWAAANSEEAVDEWQKVINKARLATDALGALGGGEGG